MASALLTRMFQRQKKTEICGSRSPPLCHKVFYRHEVGGQWREATVVKSYSSTGRALEVIYHLAFRSGPLALSPCFSTS